MNESKIHQKKILIRQVKKILDRIKSRYSLYNHKVELTAGTMEDDFLKERYALRISVNLNIN